MPLSASQLATDRNWINQQWGGGYDPSGTFQPGTIDFANGGYNTQDTTRNWGILGAADATGQSSADVSQVLGGQYTPEQIDAYRAQFAPQIDAYKQSYLATGGGDYNPSNPGITSKAGGPGGSTWGPDWAGGGYGTYTRSPAMDGIIADLTTQSNNNLTRNVLPDIGRGAVAMGGVGGSREGIAQGLAVSDSQRSLQGAIAGVENSDFQNSMNRGLTRYGMDQGNSLGNRTLDVNAGLTSRGQDMNFYTQQRGQDQSGALVGANIYDLAQKGGWAPFTTAGNIYSNYTGLGGSTTDQTSQGGGAMGAVGGAAGAYQFGKNLGWW